MTKRTMYNCSLIKRAIRERLGYPEIINGKCDGYDENYLLERIEKVRSR